jgi:hypothetical protein
MAMGGFLGSDPILTDTTLAGLVRRGEVRYFLLNGFGGGFAGFGGRGAGSADATQWVESNCSRVPISAYETARSGGFGGGFGFGGGGSLYDCRKLMSRGSTT